LWECMKQSPSKPLCIINVTPFSPSFSLSEPSESRAVWFQATYPQAQHVIRFERLGVGDHRAPRVRSHCAKCGIHAFSFLCNGRRSILVHFPKITESVSLGSKFRTQSMSKFQFTYTFVFKPYFFVAAVDPYIGIRASVGVDQCIQAYTSVYSSLYERFPPATGVC